MTRRPVLVIHGVANNDETEFNGRVRDLGRGIADLYGDHWEFIPVFWNREGADVAGVKAAIPPIDEGLLVRSGSGELYVSPEATRAGRQLLGTRSTSDADTSATSLRSVLAGVEGRSAGIAEATGVRDGRVDVVATIVDTWPTLAYLPAIDDPIVLDGVGRLVADAASEQTEEEAVRGWVEDAAALARKALRQADAIVGLVVGSVGERVHFELRTRLIPGFAKGAGDVLIYQDRAHRTEIAAIVREKLRSAGEELGQGTRLGSADQPALVIGHSLGGIIAFDLAVTDDDPIHWQAMVTFGSQSAILHILSPRGGQIEPYQTGPPAVKVSLPSTIGRWTNLWEPWDPLAFYASNVFDDAGADRVTDVRIPHLNPVELWSHSSYWTQAESFEAIGKALIEAGVG